MRAALVRLCRGRKGRTLVFANSVARANGALRLLRSEGVGDDGEVLAFHPDVPPPVREAALASFASSSRGVLVCSGLAARGIDLPNVALVVEYQLAPHLVEHVHRVGRTARAGREGQAISLVNAQSESEVALVKEVQRCARGGWKYL